MAEIAYNDIWRSDFYNNVSAKDGLQDINLYHLIEANKKNVTGQNLLSKRLFFII